MSRASALARWPALRPLAQLVYERRFRAGRYHCGYRGVYRDFESAKRALPDGLAGFDHDAMADLGHYATADGAVEPMPATEYPVLFWLRRALDEGARSLLDFGGYVGHAFRQYDRYLAFPTDFRWTVFDLPAITQAGEAVAWRDGLIRLRFVTAIDPDDPPEILLAAGSLQYFPEGHLARLLGRWSRLPRYLLVQRTPLHAARSFVTIQSMRTRQGAVSFCPYMVAARERFVSDILHFDYTLIDHWEKDRQIDVPFHPECHVQSYSGFFFERRRP